MGYAPINKARPKARFACRLHYPAPHQTDTFPSEHLTTVNGQLSFHNHVLLTASHSALVPLKVTEVREVQFPKAQSPMLVTLSGIVTEASESQYAKAYAPMLVTPFPMVTEVRELQP